MDLISTWQHVGVASIQMQKLLYFRSEWNHTTMAGNKKKEFNYIEVQKLYSNDKSIINLAQIENDQMRTPEINFCLKIF